MTIKDRRTFHLAEATRRILHSFRFRLTLLFVAILVLVLAVFSAFIYTRQAQIIKAETVNRLTAQSTQLATYYSAQLHSREEESEGHSESGIGVDLPLLPENALLALISIDGRILLQQGELSPDQLGGLIKTWNESHEKQQPLTFKLPNQRDGMEKGGTTYLYVVYPLQSEEGRGGVLLLASPLDPENQLQRLAVTLALSSLVILLFAFAGGYWLASRAMEPVQTIVHTARGISESDLSERLHLKRDDELGLLAETFDQMLDRLQAAFDRQRQFTADASHELRSPLAIIELESNRALERPRSPEDYRKVLGIISSENEWMTRLVNELLLLARLDAGQIATRAEKLDLSDIIVEVTERLSPLAQSRGVTLKTGSLEACYVQADRTHITQLLNNLVENAIKYTRRNDGWVLVEAAIQQAEEEQWSLVRVEDNGPGIPEEDVPYIFDRFYRIDKARSHPDDGAGGQDSGSGLGLAIAQTIVQSYRGKIELEKNDSTGTIFAIWLPAG